jgi:hypothetical protein
MPALLMLMLCCSIASWMDTLSCTRACHGHFANMSHCQHVTVTLPSFVPHVEQNAVKHKLCQQLSFQQTYTELMAICRRVKDWLSCTACAQSQTVTLQGLQAHSGTALLLSAIAIIAIRLPDITALCAPSRPSTHWISSRRTDSLNGMLISSSVKAQTPMGGEGHVQYPHHGL